MSVETVNCSQGGHLRGPYSDNCRPVGEKGPADHVTRQAHIPKTVFSLNIRRNSLGNVFYTSCFPCTVNGKTNVWQMWQRVTTITLLLPPVSDRTMVDCVFLKKKLKKTLEPETHYFSRPLFFWQTRRFVETRWLFVKEHWSRCHFDTENALLGRPHFARSYKRLTSHSWKKAQV